MFLVKLSAYFYNKNMEQVCIYALRDSGEIFYIGQSKSVYNRLKCHISEAKKGSTPKDKRICDILENGRELTVEILKECTSINSYEIERGIINDYIKRGFKLLNTQCSKERRIPKKRKVVNYPRYSMIDWTK